MRRKENEEIAFSGAGGQPAKTSLASNLETSTGQMGVLDTALLDVFPRSGAGSPPPPPAPCSLCRHWAQ